MGNKPEDGSYPSLPLLKSYDNWTLKAYFFKKKNGSKMSLFQCKIILIHAYERSSKTSWKMHTRKTLCRNFKAVCKKPLCLIPLFTNLLKYPHMSVYTHTQTHTHTTHILFLFCVNRSSMCKGACAGKRLELKKKKTQLLKKAHP